MEPFPLWKRIVLTGAALAAVIALGACRRAADVPGRASGPQSLSPAGQESSEKPPKRKAESSVEAPAEAGAQAGSDAQAADRKEPDRQIAAQAAASDGPLPPKEEEATGPKVPQPAESAPVPEPRPASEGQAESQPERPVPLVDDLDSLEQLDLRDPIWFDRKRKQVVMVGLVCQRYAPLELFACLKGSKEHESVLVVSAKAYVLHAGLLAAGAVPGGPVQFDPEFVPPRGTEIEVTVVWLDQQGRRKRARAQDWVRDVAQTYAMFDGVVANEYDEELNVHDQWAAWKDMEHAWVFAGSLFEQDADTGQRRYLADMEGDLICVSNFPSAVLDVPIRSSDSNAALLFEAFTERIPPLGTPVTVILKPKLE